MKQHWSHLRMKSLTLIHLIFNNIYFSIWLLTVFSMIVNGQWYLELNCIEQLMQNSIQYLIVLDRRHAED